MLQGRPGETVLHHETIDTFRKQYHDHIYAVFRIFIGLLFMQHGAQKLFGVLGGSPAAAFSQMWFAGVIEFFGGLLIAIGLFTTWVALVSSVEMIVAYFTVHAPTALAPISNRGELAVLYFAAFLFIAFHGPNRFSLDAKLCKEC